MRHITWDEISRHNNASDCWIVVDGSVYDVTDWARRHPGGDTINALAGEDVTALFHSSHLREIPGQLLDKFKIGEVDGYETEFDSVNDPFFSTLKKRVVRHLEAHEIDIRCTTKNKTSILISSFLLLFFWSCMYLAPPWGLVAAIPMGLVTCSLIGSFGHEQIHGNLRAGPCVTNAFMNDVLWGIYIPFMPRNYFQYEHLKHHCHPMHPDHDYDVYALKSLVRLTPYTTWKRHHAHQHIYAPLVYGAYIAIQLLCGYTTTFFDARELLKERHALLHISTASMTALLFHIAIPMLITGAGWTLLCASIYFISWQSAIYISSGLPHMTGQIPSRVKTSSWARYICETTVDLKCGNRFFDWLTGGLNYHLVHHLLPTVPREHLHEIREIVEATCREYGYPCKHYTKFREFYRDHYRVLTQLGRIPDPTHI